MSQIETFNTVVKQYRRITLPDTFREGDAVEITVKLLNKVKKV